MPNYFFTDSSGAKQGPINDQQLHALAANGTITPNTPLQTDTGHQGTASQIPGLKFNSAASTAPLSSRRQPQRGSIFAWLFDWKFQDLRLPVINLWACRIMYVVGCIAAIWGGIVMSFELSYIARETSGGSLVIGIPLTWLGVALLIIAARLLCEWYIIVFDWIVETTKAARIYIEKESRP